MSEGWRENPYGQSDEKDITFPLTKKREEVHSSKTRTAYKRMRLFPENYLTTNSYDESETADMRLFDRTLITIKNIHPTNSLTYEIHACIDPSDWHTLKPATELVSSGKNFEYIDQSWAFVKVLVKSTVTDTSAKPLAFAGLKSH